MDKKLNYRPEASIVQSRVHKAVSIIREFEDLVLYNSTKNKLALARDELSEGLMILNRILDDPNIRGKEIKSRILENQNSYNDDRLNLHEPVIDQENQNKILVTNSINEISEIVDQQNKQAKNKKDDLDDIISIGHNLTLSEYPPKYIISRFGGGLEIFNIVSFSITKVKEVDDFGKLLSIWFKKRFIERKANFYYRASNIVKWIELFIISAGSAIHENKFNEFVETTYKWISNLYWDTSMKFPIPYEILKYKDNKEDLYTLEAILIEKLIKPRIYNDAFYPECISSIEDDYLSDDCIYTKEDLTVEFILEVCSDKFTSTY